MFAELIIAILLVALAAFWADSLAARERANDAARELCTRRAISLLDETVALASRRLVRGAGGSLTLRRTYTFDYCEDGYSRASGFVVMEGREVITSGLGRQAAWWH
ncbi:DUF3301 domain-containing protein [Methylotetracoccus oryzae]|uniref:DUF3301 domain-containing protein n=1 Tax=Methylotetracoccus oryzae TaxID=1919059 RepID=UPI001119F67C|nr:DUF3301 domain-containing protein [Methylotetracoccus oryzae]